MKENTDEFDMILDDGRVVLAEQLSVVELDGKEYLVYAINYPDGSYDIKKAYVKKNSKGLNELFFIDNFEDYLKITGWIQDMMEEYERQEGKE